MNRPEEIRYIQAFARIIGVKEEDAFDYAHKKGLTSLVENADQLLATPAQREKHQAFLDLYRMSSSIGSRNPVIRGPETAAAFFHSVMENIHDQESFVVAFLNTRNRVIDYEIASQGTINSSIIHPREVFRKAVLNKANAVILCHNHPSGHLEPSTEDKATTKKLIEAGQIMGITVLDHVIITGLNKDDTFSFKQNSLLEEQETYSAVQETHAPYSTQKDKLKEITDRLEQGIQNVFSSGLYQDYLNTMARFYKYSANNSLLIALQRPEATLVASYNKWRDQFGRNVKKGERAIRIIAPSPYKVKQANQVLDPVTKQPLKDEKGQAVTEEKEVTIPMFRVVSVFDVSQTEGKPLPQIAAPLTGFVDQYGLLLQALQQVARVPLEFAKLPDSVDGSFNRRTGKIVLREGMSEVQTVAAAIHEIAHARLHGQQQTEEISPDKRTREVEAESVAFVVCSHLGIETGSNSFGYIASWSKDKELPELKASLSRISQVSAGLIDELTSLLVLPEQEKISEKLQSDSTELVDGSYQIYQLKAEPDLKFLRFSPLTNQKKLNQAVAGNNYQLVYQGQQRPEPDTISSLKKLVESFNDKPPADYDGYKICVGDVIAIRQNGWTRAFFMDTSDFVEVPEFLKQFDKVEKSNEIKNTSGHHSSRQQSNVINQDRSRPARKQTVGWER